MCHTVTHCSLIYRNFSLTRYPFFLSLLTLSQGSYFYLSVLHSNWLPWFLHPSGSIMYCFFSLSFQHSNHKNSDYIHLSVGSTLGIYHCPFMYPLSHPCSNNKFPSGIIPEFGRTAASSRPPSAARHCLKQVNHQASLLLTQDSWQKFLFPVQVPAKPL